MMQEEYEGICVMMWYIEYWNIVKHDMTHNMTNVNANVLILTLACHTLFYYPLQKIVEICSYFFPILNEIGPKAHKTGQEAHKHGPKAYGWSHSLIDESLCS